MEKWSQSGELNIFYLRHDPIWDTRFDSHACGENRAIKEQWQGRFIEIKDYFTSYGHRINLFVLALILLFTLIYFLRYKRPFKLFDNLSNLPIDHYLLLYKKPLVLGGFLSVLLAFFFFQNIPEALDEIGIIMLLVLSGFLFSGKMRGNFKFLIPVIILAFIIHFIKSYIWFSSSD